MQSMEIKGLTSAGMLKKGKHSRSSSPFLSPAFIFSNMLSRFGWTNASYVVGLDFLNTHQKRALGVLATWDAYEKGDQF